VVEARASTDHPNPGERNVTETQVKQDQDEMREVAQADSSLAVARSRVELDQQVATARAFPRSIKKFQQQCMEMATLNEQVAEECFYALPRDGKTVEGPSARLAEIVASSWGNCRAGARVVDEGAEFITAQGVFQDLERNVNITMEVRRRITGKGGKRYSADMIGVTGNAACSIALRNAVFRGVPKALWSGIYEAARMAAVGTVQTLADKREKMFQHFQKLGVTREAILATIGVAGEQDIDLDKLATLKGIASAIKEGETTPEQAFAPPSHGGDTATAKKGVAGLAERARAGATDAGTAADAKARHCTDMIRALQLTPPQVTDLMKAIGVRAGALSAMPIEDLTKLAQALDQEAAARADGGPKDGPQRDPGQEG
jgi:hypothetical protein